MRYRWLLSYLLLSALLSLGSGHMTPALADINFGHIDAIEEEVEELDEKVRNQKGGTGVGSCGVNYGNWLNTVQADDDLQDLEREVLKLNSFDTAGALDVVNNDSFAEADADPPELTTDTFVQRCNTEFADSNSSDTHQIFCRGYRLPDGKKYDNLNNLKSDVQDAPSSHHVISFFHAGDIDGGSDQWQDEFINQYMDQCHNRQTYVIWMGAFVKDSDGERQVSKGTDWHLTSTKWGPPDRTVLFNSMAESRLNITGHSTVNCPMDSSDTNGLYPGGEAESEGRDITNFVGSNALWVGNNSANQSACYSGVASSNPVNANSQRKGVQIELRVGLPVTEEKVNDETVVKAILREW